MSTSFINFRTLPPALAPVQLFLICNDDVKKFLCCITIPALQDKSSTSARHGTEDRNEISADL